jgi:hypothetical protein
MQPPATHPDKLHHSGVLPPAGDPTPVIPEAFVITINLSKAWLIKKALSFVLTGRASIQLLATSSGLSFIVPYVRIAICYYSSFFMIIMCDSSNKQYLFFYFTTYEPYLAPLRCKQLHRQCSNGGTSFSRYYNIYLLKT